MGGKSAEESAQRRDALLLKLLKTPSPIGIEREIQVGR